jgi:hypothetical protein
MGKLQFTEQEIWEKLIRVQIASAAILASTSDLKERRIEDKKGWVAFGSALLALRLGEEHAYSQFMGK